MGKRRLRIAFAVILVAILSVCLWSELPPREPSYKGKSLSVWLQDYPQSFSLQKQDTSEEDEAVRQIGTNAIPTLLRMLRAKDSALKTQLIMFLDRHPSSMIEITPDWYKNQLAFRAIEALGPDATNAIPNLVQIYNDKVSTESQMMTALSIGAIGPTARSAIPSLLRGVKTMDGPVRASTVEALGGIHSEPELVVPELVKLLYDPYTTVCRHAADALGAYGTNAMMAVPALIGKLNDSPASETYLRATITNALKQIDPEAAAKAGVK